MTNSRKVLIPNTHLFFGRGYFFCIFYNLNRFIGRCYCDYTSDRADAKKGQSALKRQNHPGSLMRVKKY